MLIILLLFSIISSFFGCFILWHRITNYFDSFAHSAVFSVALSHILHLNELTTLVIFSLLFSSLLCYFIVRNIALNNNLLIITGSFFIALASILNNYCGHQHNNGHHCTHDHNSQLVDLLIGSQISNWPMKEVIVYTIALSILFIISLFFARNWIKNIINHQLVARNKLYYLYYFSFLFIIGIFSIITVKFNGMLLAIALTIFPALIGRFFARTPYQLIIYAILIGVILTIISFLLSMQFHIQYNTTLLILEFMIFISLISIKKRI